MLSRLLAVLFLAVGVFADDAYEPNNSLGTAYALVDADVWLDDLLGMGVAEDDDWFEIAVPAGHERVAVDCLFLSALGDLDLELRNTAGVLLAASETIDDNEAIDFTVASAGTYYIHVFEYGAGGGGGGNSYNLKWSALVPAPTGAADDEYEHNDSYASGYPLDEKTWLSDLLGEGVQSDDDFYRIEVSSGYEAIEVQCNFSHDGGDIDLYLLDSAGTVIASSTSGSDNETISKTVYAGGVYYIKVAGYPGDTDNHYDLWWDDLPAAGTTDDEYESNNSRAAAFPFAGEQTWLSSLQGRGIQLDTDWFSIEVSPGTAQIEVDCRFTNSVGNLDVALYGTYGQLLTNAASATDNEYILFPVVSTGVHHIAVSGAGGTATGNSYDLWWDDVPAPIPVDDEYEDNDALASAYSFSRENTWLSSIEGLGRQSDSDWYGIEVSPGFLWVKADCLFSHAEGNIDLVLCSASGEELAASRSTDDNESITAKVPSPGTYYLWVHQGDAGNTYDLRWDDLAAPPVQTDDPYEENDNLSAAYSLEGNADVWLSALLGEGVVLDDDWFGVTVEGANQRILVECQFSHAGGDIDLELYDSSSQLVAASTSAGDGESIDAEVGAGSYFIRVFAYSGAVGNSYDLWWDTAVRSNAAPHRISLDPWFIDENEPAGTVVGTLQSEDINLGDTFTYALVAGIGDSDNHRFALSGDELSTAEMLDYEKTASPTIRVRTTDSTGLWYEQVLSVDVFDVDETPTITDYSLPGNGEVVLTWSSMVNNRYAVEASTNLAEGFHPVGSNLLYTPPENSFTGTVGNARHMFWRIVIEEN